MKNELQLQLKAFDISEDPSCRGDPGRNGFRVLCYQCPFSERKKQHLSCARYRCTITAREKYGLSRWRAIRAEILARDGRSCRICGSTEWLHIHHVDKDVTCGDSSHLISLCETCHGRLHSGITGGGETMKPAFTTTRGVYDPSSGGKTNSSPCSAGF
jgi:hypothetical protein